MSNKNYYCLTTVDNPYDPFTQFDSWFLYDEEKGYHTCGLLGRVANINLDMSEEESRVEIERAIDSIIKHDFTNLYRRVEKTPDKIKEAS